jgi:hypothetical protein
MAVLLCFLPKVNSPASVPVETSSGSSSLRLALEVESDFAGHRSRRDIVGSTKGRKEVVQGDFVGHVDDREARAPAVAITVK